jgi:hypothetical protein
MARGPWPTFADVLVAVIATAGAAFLLLLAAFASLIGGRLVAGSVLSALALSIVAAVWLTRRRRPEAPGPGSWAESVRRFMVAALAVSAVAAGAAFAATAIAIRPPAQATVAAALREHRGDFEALRDMVLEDRLFSVIEGGDTYAREPFTFRTPGELGIPATRVSSYRQRMKEVQCPRIDVMHDGSVGFSLASWGAANRGWRVSLVWSREKPTPLLPTIDGFRKGQGTSTWESAYSDLGGHWYAAIVW